MHRFCWILGILFAVPLAAQPARTVTRTLPLAPDGTLAIDTYKGSIHVTTWDRAEVAVEARIVAGSGDDELVRDTRIRFDGDERRRSLETDYDAIQRYRDEVNWEGFSLPEVHYTIRMPASAALHINDYKSAITVSGLRAALFVDTYKGGVDVDAHAGSLRLETYKGEVALGFAGLPDDVAIETFKGTVTLRLPGDAGFDLDADLGRRGNLEADFPLPVARAPRHEDRGYLMAVHGGGPRLHLETHKGTFRLHTR